MCNYLAGNLKTHYFALSSVSLFLSYSNSWSNLIILSAIWLPHSHLWAIIKGTASFYPMIITAPYANHSNFLPEGLRVGSLSPPKHLVGFESGTFQFIYNVLIR